MVVHNPNNWHWVDKNCLQWTKDYLNEQVVDTKYESEQFKFVIPSVDSVSGDCDVTQRKGKVLCIYDMRLQFVVTGEYADQKQELQKISGNIVVPEFVHDQDEDDYVFEINIDDKKVEIKKYLIPALKEKLMKFQDDLLSTHAKDVQHTTDQ